MFSECICVVSGPPSATIAEALNQTPEAKAHVAQQPAVFQKGLNAGFSMTLTLLFFVLVNSMKFWITFITIVVQTFLNI